MLSDKPISERRVPPAVLAGLARFFRRNGYLRRQNAQRLRTEGWMGYKKGDEVRLTAESQQELENIRDLLRRAGFTPGRPFLKGRQYRQPVYGREAVKRFIQLIGVPVNAEPTARAKRHPRLRHGCR